MAYHWPNENTKWPILEELTGKTLCKYGPVFAPYLHDWTLYGINTVQKRVRIYMAFFLWLLLHYGAIWFSASIRNTIWLAHHYWLWRSWHVTFELVGTEQKFLSKTLKELFTTTVNDRTIANKFISTFLHGNCDTQWKCIATMYIYSCMCFFRWVTYKKEMVNGYF